VIVRRSLCPEHGVHSSEPRLAIRTIHRWRIVKAYPHNKILGFGVISVLYGRLSRIHKPIALLCAVMAAMSKTSIAVVGVGASVAAFITQPAFRAFLEKWTAYNAPGGAWRILAIVLALANLKNLPLVWHVCAPCFPPACLTRSLYLLVDDQTHILKK
jgi:hypothetical protein